MIHERNKRILLAGYANDLAEVVPKIAVPSADITLVDEKASDVDVSKAADIVVFVISMDTFYSSQLHSIFVYVHDRVLARQEYLLGIENIDLSKAAFPEIARLPQISIRDLKRMLEGPGPA